MQTTELHLAVADHGARAIVVMGGRPAFSFDGGSAISLHMPLRQQQTPALIRSEDTVVRICAGEDQSVNCSISFRTPAAIATLSRQRESVDLVLSTPLHTAQDVPLCAGAQVSRSPAMLQKGEGDVILNIGHDREANRS